MNLEQRIRSLPAVSNWPDMASLVGSLRGGDFPHWEYPEYAFLASGGSGAHQSVGSAAVYCLLLSIRLVDDLLDGDVRGPAGAWQAPRAANVALAFQAAAGEIVEAAELPAERRGNCHARLARAALLTAHGQALDLQPLESEQDYWRVVDAKTGPLLRASLALGAEIAGASAAGVEALARLGPPLGRVIQIHDDLHDALLGDGLSDWRRPRHNLALHYALVAEHDERERFAALVERADDPQARAEARRILTRSGALSYCVYHLIELHAWLRQALDELNLPRRGVFDDLLDRHAAPVEQLLRQAGVQAPRRLLRP